MTSNSYLYRKLHSLLGVIPVGFFLLEHMYTNFLATISPERYQEQVAWLTGLPLVILLEIFFIWLPLLYHGVYGLYVAFQARNNITNYSFFRNQMFVWQRITGVLTFLFVVWHFAETRLQVALGNVPKEELGALIHQILSNPIALTLYIIGVIAASFHFCNGMWAFLVSWGITVGPKAQRISTYVWMIAFVIMSSMFIAALLAFTNQEFSGELSSLTSMIAG
jgi:succinate dehydrogenase / fumarate reductase cytochrome b subunit